MRRVLWNIYAVPLTLFILGGEVYTVVNMTGLLSILDLIISLPALVALHLHIWDKRFLSATFWKPYAFVFPLWDFLYNTLLEPISSGKQFDPQLLIVPVILLPLYVSVLRYAYRKWG